MALGKNFKKSPQVLGEKKSPSPHVPKLANELEKEKNIEPPEAQPSQKPGKQKKKGSEKALQQLNQEVNVSQNVAQDSTMLVTFPVGSEEYAIAIDRIKEVVVAPRIAPVPQAPTYIRGVTNVRGHVLAVLDLAIKFSLNGAGSMEKAHGSTYVIVTKDDEYQIAVAVDQVPDTLMVSNSTIDKSGAMIKNSKKNQDYITGIVKIDNRMIIMIDIHQMIRSENTDNPNPK